jgi:hypothetical protein
MHKGLSSYLCVDRAFLKGKNVAKLYNIVVCLLGNETNNLWVLDLTLHLLDIHQAELQLIIALLFLL